MARNFAANEKKEACTHEKSQKDAKERRQRRKKRKKYVHKTKWCQCGAS